MALANELVLPSELTALAKDHESFFPPSQLPLDAIFAKMPLANTLPTPESLEDQALRTYMRDFVKFYPQAFLAWEAGGLVQNLQTHNIIEHQVIGAIYADILAEEVGLSQGERRDITLAYLIHDATKLYENQRIERLVDTSNTRKASTTRKAIGKNLTQTQKQTEILLSHIGISQDVLTLSCAVTPQTVYGPIDTPSKIIHWIDAAMDGSIIKTPQERFQTSDGHGGARRRRNQLTHKTLAARLEVDDYAKLQVSLAQRESHTFIAAINARPQEVYQQKLSLPSDLPRFLMERLSERVKAFQD